MNDSISEAIAACLSDYTTDRRGDVGSLVRIEAIGAVRVAFQHDLLQESKAKQVLVAKICGLATEKLDKVRYQAWCCLRDLWSSIWKTAVPIM